MVLLHGLASSHKVWQPLIKQVGDDWNIVAPDLIGFGDSPTPAWSSYDVAFHARHVQALLRRFWIAEPVTVVAHSMGCLIAAHLAVQYPGSVKRLILFEPPLFADVPGYVQHQRIRKRYFAFFRYIVTHPQLLFTASGETRRRIANLTGISMRPETWVPFKRSLENTIMEQQAYDELHALQVPTDIIHGRLDFVVTRSEVQKMFASNPAISFHSVAGTHGVSVRSARHIAQILGNVR